MAERSAAVTVGPGSLMSVLVCSSSSTTLVLVRVSPGTSKAQQSMEAAASMSWMRRPTDPPSRARARDDPPRASTTLVTLMPLPPGSSRRDRTRLTSSTANPST